MLLALSFSEIMYFIIPLVIASTIPLSLVALGALYSERSGVVNIALEGIMLMGAYVGAVVIQQMEQYGVSTILLLIVSILFGGAVGFIPFILTKKYLNNPYLKNLITFFTSAIAIAVFYFILNALGNNAQEVIIHLLISTLFGLFIGYVLLSITLFLLDFITKHQLDLDNPKLKRPLFASLALISVIVFYIIFSSAEKNVQVALTGLLVGAIVGTGFSIFHAFASINMKANQIISATALNMFAPAFAIFINRTFSENGTQKVTIQESYRMPQLQFLSDIPSIGEIAYRFWWVILILLVVVSGIIALIGKFKERSIDETLVKLKSIGRNKWTIAAAIFLVVSAILYASNSGLNLDLGDLFFSGVYLSTLLGVLIFVSLVVVLYKTRYGLRLRSCGENPQAADSLGINIYKIRYSGVLISGALAGMGGVVFVLSFAANFNATVSGFGFLALAVLIFGNWKPGRIIMAALFFAFMRVIANTYSVIPFLDNLNLDSELYSMLPYLATLIVLAFVSKNSASPKAAGEPYDAGKR